MRDLDRKERALPTDLNRKPRVYVPSGLRAVISETSADYISVGPFEAAKP